MQRDRSASIRPFQIDLLFLVNLGSKNLPASQERKNKCQKKKTTAKLYDTNTKHNILVILLLKRPFNVLLEDNLKKKTTPKS